MPIDIRPMKPTDVAQVYQSGIDVEQFQTSETESKKTPFWPKERLYKWVNEENDVLLIAEDEDRIVGYFLSHLHQPTGIAYIENLYVAKTYRRQGIGTTLMKNGLKRLSENGCRYVAALTKPSNTTMQSLLERDGFNRGETFIWMDKLLK